MITLGMAMGLKARASSTQPPRGAARCVTQAATKVSATTKVAAMAASLTLV